MRPEAKRERLETTLVWVLMLNKMSPLIHTTLPLSLRKVRWNSWFLTVSNCCLIETSTNHVASPRHNTPVPTPPGEGRLKSRGGETWLWNRSSVCRAAPSVLYVKKWYPQVWGKLWDRVLTVDTSTWYLHLDAALRIVVDVEKSLWMTSNSVQLPRPTQIQIQCCLKYDFSIFCSNVRY